MGKRDKSTGRTVNQGRVSPKEEAGKVRRRMRRRANITGGVRE